MIIDRCPSTLKSGFNGYSPAVLRRMFGGRSVACVLPYLSPGRHESTSMLFRGNASYFFPGGQGDRVMLVLQKNKLRLALPGESGEYVLRLNPAVGKYNTAMCMNQHLTMQIAGQVFHIETVPNALIFFEDHSSAFLQQIAPNIGEDRRDFATLAQKSAQRSGGDAHRKGTCEDLFHLLKAHCASYLVEARKLFRRLIFNYLFSNSDGHLLSFSLARCETGGFVLAPATELLCTQLHNEGPDIGLSGGLFADGFTTASWREEGYYGHDDFYMLGTRAGLPARVVAGELKAFHDRQPMVQQLIAASFLPPEVSEKYSALFTARLARMTFTYLDNV